MTVSAITSVRQVPLPGMLRSLPRSIMLNVDRVGVGDTVGVGVSVDVGLAVAVTCGVLVDVALGPTTGLSVAWKEGSGKGVTPCAGDVARRTARVGVAVGATVAA
jgi:hypothetical protein